MAPNQYTVVYSLKGLHDVLHTVFWAHRACSLAATSSRTPQLPPHTNGDKIKTILRLFQKIQMSLDRMDQILIMKRIKEKFIHYFKAALFEMTLCCKNALGVCIT